MSTALVFAIVALVGFVGAMFQNWLIIRRIDEEKRDSFRSGYYHGYLASRLGRENDWRFAHREEEDRERVG
jgi:hypothetical protein